MKEQNTVDMQNIDTKKVGKKHAGQRVVAGLAHGLAVTLLASSAHAAWDVRPVIKAESEVNDNVRLLEDKDGGMINSITAQLASRWAANNNRLDLVVGGTYANYDGVLRYDDTSAGFLRLNGRRNYERGAIGINTSAQLDDYKRVYNQIGQGIDVADDGLFLDESNAGLLPGEDVDVNQEAVVEQIDRTRVFVKPYAEYRFSQRSIGRIYGQYTSLDFEDLGDQLGLRESERKEIGLDYEYAISERGQLGIDLTAGEFSPDNSDDIDSIEARLGWSYQYSPNLRYNIYLGAREVDTGDDEDTGALYRIEAERKLKTGRLRVNIERSLYPSAFGRIIEGDTFNLAYRSQITERFGARFNIQASSVDTEDSQVSDDNRDYASASPELIWALNENSSVHFRYTYQWIDREEDEMMGLDPADSHSFSIGFEYHPRSRF